MPLQRLQAQALPQITRASQAGSRELEEEAEKEGNLEKNMFQASRMEGVDAKLG